MEQKIDDDKLTRICKNGKCCKKRPQARPTDGSKMKIIINRTVCCYDTNPSSLEEKEDEDLICYVLAGLEY